MSSTNSDTVVEEKIKLKAPSKWTVLVLNDDFTPMDFVIAIMMEVFHYDMSQAEELMMKIHLEGKAAVGLFSKEIAETKANRVMLLASQEQYPLKAEPTEA